MDKGKAPMEANNVETRTEKDVADEEVSDNSDTTSSKEDTGAGPGKKVGV